jgi:hypothetical protein
MNKTERQIIEAVYKAKARMCTSYDVGVPNCFTQHDNEADLFLIRKSGLCDEVEIKVSRSDLLQDKKKIVKYRECEYLSNSENSDVDGKWLHDHQHLSHDQKKKIVAPWQMLKPEALGLGRMDCNYFWYAIKDGIGGIEDIPDFAGLIIVKDDGELYFAKRPDRLHANKMSFEDRYKIARKTSYRFWKSEFGIGF